MSRPLARDHIDVDLFDPALFARGIPYDAFAVLREHAPVAFHEERPRRAGGRPGPGFWCLTRHADVHFASCHPELFSSYLGGFTSADISGAVLDETRLNLMGMDPPDHTALRRAIREPFSPRMVKGLAPAIEAFAARVVDGVIGTSAEGERLEFDFVTEVAAELPLLVLAHLLGVAEEDRGLFFDWSNQIIGNHDPDFGGTIHDFLRAKEEIFAYARTITEAKRAAPADDLVSHVVAAEIEGEPLSNQTIVILWFLLLIAGNETTRSSLTGAMEMLSEHPDQRALLMADLDGSLAPFVEEMLRVTNPVLHFRRTATRDIELGGAMIEAGDKVVLWYPSANRDEAVFDRPDDFDLTRRPNPHLAFGVGTHFCLGARIGRLSIRTMLRELLTRLPDIEVAGEPERLHSMFLSGAKSLPVTATSPGRS
jgi:cytochrome P450